MSKYQTKRSEGFTIIEVLIVLAIAGLIMLVVFLAVPNLQRNSRNNSYRSEANNILAAYTEISSNKNGAVLTASNSGTAGSDAEKVKQAANSQNITTVVIEAQSGSTAASLTQAVLRTGAKCTAADSATTPAGSSRQVALLYMVETASGTQVQCQSS